MNPAHEALRLVREIVAMDDERVRTGRYDPSKGVPFMEAWWPRARGVLLASQGVDGNGVRQPESFILAPDPKSASVALGWCSSCGAYHELTGDVAEVIR